MRLTGEPPQTNARDQPIVPSRGFETTECLLSLGRRWLQFANQRESLIAPRQELCPKTSTDSLRMVDVFLQGTHDLRGLSPFWAKHHYKWSYIQYDELSRSIKTAHSKSKGMVNNSSETFEG